MFGITRRKRVDVSDLLNSELFNENTFYKKFFQDVSAVKKSIFIESPYLTERRSLQFAKAFRKNIKSGVSVMIYTRNPKHHEKLLEVQAWKSIIVLKECGARVLCVMICATENLR